MKITEWRHI